jgi:CHASE3 domain sensor protein
MSWYKKTGIRRQVFGVFSVVIVIVMIVSLIGITGINRVAEDVNSLYYDRLYPAVEMAKITETLYENRLFLEEYLNLDDEKQRSNLLKSIKVNHKIIDSLVAKYAESHLVDEENNNLLMYRKEIFKYRQLENEILQLYNSDIDGAKMLFSTESSEEFKKMIEPIHRMTDVQLKIGEELRADSIKEANAIRLALYIAMGIILIVFIAMGAWLGFVYMNQG